MPVLRMNMKKKKKKETPLVDPVFFGGGSNASLNKEKMAPLKTRGKKGKKSGTTEKKGEN